MKNIKTYFKKILIVTIFLMIVVTISACDQSNDNLQETLTNTISDNATCTTGLSEETTTETTTEATTEATTETVTDPVETTTAEAVPDDYKRLKDKLKHELDKKSFDEEINYLFYDTLNALYKNYPTWKHGYRDLPDTEKYITENLINVVQNVDNAVFYDIESEEGKQFFESGHALGWVQQESNGELTLSVTSYKAKKSKVMNARKSDIERFYHEVIHCKQKKILWNYDYFDNNATFFDLLIEGGTTFHSKFVNPYSLDLGGSWKISRGDKLVAIEYTKSNCMGYLVNLNAYEKLVYLVGYDVIDGIEKAEIPFSAVRNTIVKNYGEEQGNKFYYLMESWYAEYLNSSFSDKIFNLSLELEYLFWDLMEQDIKALSSKEEATAYKPIYDFYMQRNMPIVTRDYPDEHTFDYITSEYFDSSELDEMLNEKLK
jgi:hypothetical protein